MRILRWVISESKRLGLAPSHLNAILNLCVSLASLDECSRSISEHELTANIAANPLKLTFTTLSLKDAVIAAALDCGFKFRHLQVF